MDIPKFRQLIINFIDEIITNTGTNTPSELYALKAYFQYIAGDYRYQTIRQRLAENASELKQHDINYVMTHEAFITWLTQFISHSRLEDLFKNIWFGGDSAFHGSVWSWLDALVDFEWATPPTPSAV